MKKLLLILLIPFLSSCDKQIVRDKFENGDIEIRRYFYSYITSISMDFIEIKCDQTERIFASQNQIDSIAIVDDQIIIFCNDLIHTMYELRELDSICNYQLVFKEQHYDYLKKDWVYD